VVTLQPHGDLPPFFCLPGITETLCICTILREKWVRIDLFLSSVRPRRPLTESLPQIAARYAEAIMATNLRSLLPRWLLVRSNGRL